MRDLVVHLDVDAARAAGSEGVFGGERRARLIVTGTLSTGVTVLRGEAIVAAG